MSTSAFEPVTIAHVFQPGREADPHAPEQELQLVRTGKFVFTYAHPAGNENNATSMLHEVLAFVGQGKRRVRHMYSNQSHVTVEVTDTEIIARDFDGNDDRQHFTRRVRVHHLQRPWGSRSIHVWSLRQRRPHHKYLGIV